MKLFKCIIPFFICVSRFFFWQPACLQLPFGLHSLIYQKGCHPAGRWNGNCHAVLVRCIKRRLRMECFQILDNGQIAPVPLRYTDKVAQIEDNLCHITECFVPDYGDHYIHLTYMSTDQDPLPSVSDSAFSTFHSYEIENGVARMYCFLPIFPNSLKATPCISIKRPLF